MPINFPILLLVQAVAIGITALFYSTSVGLTWLLSVYIFGFSHYFIGAYYSRHKMKHVVASPKHYLPLAVLAIAGYYIYTYLSASFILLYFGLHHALSEGYLHQRYSNLTLAQKYIVRIQATSFFIHGSGFILLVRHDRSFNYEALTELALFILPIAAGYFLMLLWQSRHQLTAVQISRLTGSEALLITALLVSTVYPITFLQVVFYHFTFWALLPFLKLMAGFQINMKPIALYSALTLISLLVITQASPLYHSTSSKFIQFEKWFLILSYTHITLSFAISTANPQWINNLFYRPQVKTENK